MLTDAAKFVGYEAIKTAANIAIDAIDGKEVNESVLKSLFEILVNNLRLLFKKVGTKKILKVF